MKRIKKLTKSTKAVAGTALLLGATVVGGAAFAAAQDNGSSGDLGDFPSPYVDDEGEVSTAVAVGDDAATIDVVGAIDVAGALGNAAFTEEEVEASGSTGSWSATNGVTLDTVNDNLYFGDTLDTVRETLTEDNLGMLEETTFSDDNNDETDITNYLGVGDDQVSFGNSPDGLDNEDPVVHIPVDSESGVGASNYLINLQSTFENEIDFTAEDVEGEEITLFGQEYTIAQDQDEDVDELVLFGQESVTNVATGESTTVTVGSDQEEVSLNTVSVADGSTSGSTGSATVEVQGDLETVESGDTFAFGDEEIRVDEIYNTGATDDGQGTVAFSVGSQELRFIDQTQIEDGNGDDVEGTYVEYSGNNITELSGLTVYLGSQDDDNDYLAAGETFTHSAFPGLEVHFGGLNPDTMEDGAEVEVNTQGDDTAQVEFPATGDESATVGFAHSTSDGGNGGIELQNDDGDAYVVAEGQAVEEDEFVAADAGDFPHLWEVTSVDRSSGEEAEIDVRDAVTGDTRTLELPEDTDDTFTDSVATHNDEEIIDGQTYHVWVNNNDEVYFTWGDSSDFGNSGDETTLYAPLDAPTGHAVALTGNITDAVNDSVADGSSNTHTLELPSTESTDAKTADIVVDGDGSGGINITIGDNSEQTGQTGSTTDTFDVGQITYEANVTLDDDSGDNNYTIDVTPNATSGPAAVLMHPENDNDNENAYVVEPGYDSSDDEVQVASTPTYTGTRQGTSLESNDDIEARMDEYGSYSETDTDEQGGFTLNVAAGQSTVGAAVTQEEGSLSTGGGSSTVMSMSPTGWPTQTGALDTDSNIDTRKVEENIVLVGGPAVNDLTQELAEANKTWSAGDYSEDTAIVQHVEGAFAEGYDALVVAGHSGEDTREAANFLANYEANSGDLEGTDQVTLSTTEGTTVQ